MYDASIRNYVIDTFHAVMVCSCSGRLFTWDVSGMTTEHAIITVTQITGHHRISSPALSVKTLIKPLFISHELLTSAFNYNISVLHCNYSNTKHWQNTDFRQQAKNM